MKKIKISFIALFALVAAAGAVAFTGNSTNNQDLNSVHIRFTGMNNSNGEIQNPVNWEEILPESPLPQCNEPSGTICYISYFGDFEKFLEDVVNLDESALAPAVEAYRE